jgi:uncharacterized spore protein YtfJ
MSLPEVIQAALEKIQYIAKTETVVGEPIVAGKVTIIPVSKVSVGFAAGGAGNEQKFGTGTGTGGGINVTPVAFIVITEDKVQVHPIEKAEIELGSLLAYAPDIIKKVANYMKNKDKDKKADSHSRGESQD